jgi:dipeptidyl aminopeptidase/acylaminoacyl peptidase
MFSQTHAFLRVVLALGLVAYGGAITSAQPVREPLPLDVITSIQSNHPRSPVDLSPDGEWLAHTYGRAETVLRQTILFSASGVSFAEGNARMQAALTNTKTGQVIRLGGDKGSSWDAVWSPDGKRVAFYADDMGEASLWIWERSTGKADRFPGVIVRPFFGFEVVRWSADSQRILCKILPVGMTVAQANALVPDDEAPRRFSAAAPDQPSVFVLRAHMEDAKPEDQAKMRPNAGDRALADLAILDLDTRRVVTRVPRIRTTWYAFAPDQKHIAYADFAGWEPNTQQSIYDLVLYELATGHRRVLAERVRSDYGIDANWSPDGRRLAYITSGQLAKGELNIVRITQDGVSTITARDAASFDTEIEERAPLWSADGETIYAIGSDGKLWKVDASSGESAVAGDLPGHQMQILVNQPDRSTVWSTDGGRTIWALGRTRDREQAGIYRVDLSNRSIHPEFQEKKLYSASFSVDASDVTKSLVFVARDQRHPADLWQFSIPEKTAVQITRLNAHLDRYELGTTRLIEWETADGQKLRGALLLPPGYAANQRAPLVVWVYGGSNGSANINTFGLVGQGATFNMQVLATRGYAVLFPDAPVREGRVTEDLLRTVMPGVDAAIDQGYADPDRLAVMGQSFGAHNVLSLLVHTDRFKAAVISAAVGHPDLFSAYADMGFDGTATSTGYYERGQGRMGGTPWQYPDRYRENSPFFLFDRIQTPVLIGQGEKDGRLIASDAVFVGLQRLGKKVEYRIYENEGHVISGKANVLDFWNRRLEFLDEWLDVARNDRGQMIIEDGHAKGRSKTRTR